MRTHRARWTRVVPLLAAVALTLVLLPPYPASADDTLIGQVVEIVGVDGPVEFGDRLYAGRLRITISGDRVVLVEHVDPDTYMRGIREVPASWNPETLRAQAIAARTYLAWTLARGRAGAAGRYGFDICATSACQVYRGGAGEKGAEPWDRAVEDTAGEVLLYDGSPAQALYSSTTGGTTRNIEEVYGATPKPYLVAVDSPGEDSPFVKWTFELTRRQMVKIFRASGIASEFRSLSMTKTDDGEGPWTVKGVFSDGERTWTSWQFRGLMNSHGPEALGDLLPAKRPDGRHYPQTILSPTYTISRSIRPDPDVRMGLPLTDVFTFTGGGWGHDVGMSQYGAQAMAEAGATHEEVLAHYYSGLSPERDPGFLPEELVVGLSYDQGPLVVGGDRRLAISIDGAPVADDLAGAWTFESTGAALRITPPVAFGVEPGLERLATPAPTRGQLVVAAVPEWGRVRLIVFDAGRPIYRGSWMNWFGGRVVFTPPHMTGGPTISVVVQRENPETGAVTVVPVTPAFVVWR